MAMPRIARSAGLLSMGSRPSVVYRVSESHRLRLYCSARPSVVLLDRRRRSAWRPASGEPRLWAYVVDERPWAGNRAPAAFYRYSPDRKGERPRDHLAGYQGFLHTDAYSGYESLYRPRGNKAPMITQVACMAHARRYFFDVYDATKSPIAEEALRRIQELYVIETEINGKPAEIRHAERQARAAPLLASFKRWAEAE